MAKGYAHLAVTSAGDTGSPRWLASGTYSDRLRKCGGGCWLFESRVLAVDSTAPSLGTPGSAGRLSSASPA